MDGALKYSSKWGNQGSKRLCSLSHMEILLSSFLYVYIYM